MKRTLIVITFVSLLIAGCNNSSTTTEQVKAADAMTLDTAKLKSGDMFYQCEMHPEVVSNKAGTCSKCAMDLEKVTKK